jgi:hypothetical protein
MTSTHPSEIVLATINAKWIHTAFGLRCLHANLGELGSRAEILEFTLESRPVDIAEAILSRAPKVVGLGVYVWNVAQSTELISILRAAAPDLLIVLGGPEVSYEAELQPICGLADAVVRGEGELAFRELCERWVLRREKPASHIVEGGLPPLDKLTLPYHLYSETDCAHRVIYVEASRGCPYSCEFCLSSLDEKVRMFPVDSLLAALDDLLDRGALQFKFVDRTFNLKIAVAQRIMSFFLERMRPGLFVHFEMVPDRFPTGLRELVARFPEGSLQLEVGVQTLDPATEARVSRRQDQALLEDNLRYLREHTGVHIHADLIAGLPGENIESFAVGFDRLYGMGVHEIQVGTLKRLRGAPIARHTGAFGMVYSPHPPYQVLSTNAVDFFTMRRVERFSRFWDIFSNSGAWKVTMRGMLGSQPSPFAQFWAFSAWVWAQTGATAGISQVRQCELLFRWLTEELKLQPADVAGWLWDDRSRLGHAEPLSFLRGYVDMEGVKQLRRANRPNRQARHQAAVVAD